MSSIRALIADDHEVYRAGLGQLLRATTYVGETREVGSFDEALDLLEEGSFGLACFDLEMPGMIGPGTMREVRLAYPGVKLVMISSCEDPAVISTALASGADAYITKTTPVAQMVERIESVIKTGQPLASAASSPKPAAETPSFARLRELTPRQQHVLACIANGQSNKEIARELGIAPGTVKIHVAALFGFYGVHSRAKLMIKAGS